LVPRRLAARRVSGKVKVMSVVTSHDNNSEDNDHVSDLLMEAADFFAATLAVADPRAWQHLLVYAPLDILKERVNAKCPE
jgi:hypothetical protein